MAGEPEPPLQIPEKQHQRERRHQDGKDAVGDAVCAAPPQDVSQHDSLKDAKQDHGGGELPHPRIV